VPCQQEVREQEEQRCDEERPTPVRADVLVQRRDRQVDVELAELRQRAEREARDDERDRRRERPQRGRPVLDGADEADQEEGAA
jgi:hypothetical protein